MRFVVSDEMFEQYPEFVVGVIFVRGCNNLGESGEVMEMMRKEEMQIRKRYDVDTLLDEPWVSSWREAYRSFGVKKNQYTSSVENLFRMVLSDKDIRQINPLVDVYNLICLRHRMPIGGEDVDMLSGDVVLRKAGVDESPVLLIGETEARSPKEDEIIYADGVSAICRRWNWREADRTKLTSDTKNCILVVDALPPFGEMEVKLAIDELGGLVERFCGGECFTHIISNNNSNKSFKF